MKIFQHKKFDKKRLNGKILDIGCGRNKLPGAIGLDYLDLPEVDIVANLDDKLPFEDGTFDVAYANQVFEHVENLTDLIAECFRILKYGGIVVAHVPYFRSSWSAIDPTHVRQFSICSMNYFVQGKYEHKNYRFFEASFSNIECYLDADYPPRPLRWVFSSLALRLPYRFENSMCSFIYPFESFNFCAHKMTFKVKNKVFLTVATTDYLPQCLVTILSAKRHDEYVNFYIFLIDLSSKELPKLREMLGEDYHCVSIFCPDELDSTCKNLFKSASKYYSAMELCCLGKYIGVKHVLTKLSLVDICVYSDCDILFCSSVDRILSEINGKVMLISPHQIGPTNALAEFAYLLHGWSNAGFFAISGKHHRSMEILDWLITRIATRGFAAPEIGMYCDQAWVSLMPLLFYDDIAICWDSGCNVAYWNLSNRLINRIGEEYFVNTSNRLIFIHFSGFSFGRDRRLSRHDNLKVPEQSPLEELCIFYKLQLNKYLNLSLHGINKKSLSNDGLKVRIRECELINNIQIEAPSYKRGFFMRIGARIDALIG